jgi:hypothetical protein
VNRPTDNIVMHSYNNISSAPGINMISWQLDDPNGTAISSDLLDPAPPYLPNWQQPFGLSIDGMDPPTMLPWFIRANVDYVGP